MFTVVAVVLSSLAFGVLNGFVVVLITFSEVLNGFAVVPITFGEVLNGFAVVLKLHPYS